MLKREILNRALLIRILQLSGSIKGKALLQKLVFDIETQSRKQNINNMFNYEFIRWPTGPFCKELFDDLQFLINKELVEKGENEVYKLTIQGNRYSQNSWHILKDFLDGENIMNAMVNNFISKDSEKEVELLEETFNKYKMENYKVGEVIEDLKYVGV